MSDSDNYSTFKMRCQESIVPTTIVFCKKRERQLGVLGGRVFVYAQSFTFLHLDLGKSRK